MSSNTRLVFPALLAFQLFRVRVWMLFSVTSRFVKKAPNVVCRKDRQKWNFTE
jgi:hypothetical protein